MIEILLLYSLINTRMYRRANSLVNIYQLSELINAFDLVVQVQKCFKVFRLRTAPPFLSLNY